MKKFNPILIGYIFLITVGCSNNLEVESLIINNESSLYKLVNLMKTSEENEICIKNNIDKTKKIIDLLTKNSIDCIRMQIAETNNDFNTEDSLIIMTKWVDKIIRQPEYIIYDFSKSDRILDNIDIPNAAFKRKRIKGKWYVAEQGFD